MAQDKKLHPQMAFFFLRKIKINLSRTPGFTFTGMGVVKEISCCQTFTQAVYKALRMGQMLEMNKATW